MGFHDADWAQTLELPLAEKAVLLVVALATDDAKHTTFVGQETIAARSGASVKTVSRALGTLEASGLLRRSRRAGKGGYRTSDLITLNRAYQSESLGGAQPTRQSALEADSPDLPDSLSTPTGLSVGAIDITQIGHPEDHPDTAGSSFDDFWAIWPKKAAKKSAQVAWVRAVKRAEPRTILTAARAYASSPKLPKPDYIPHGATWLNGDRWEDERVTTTMNNQSAVEARCAREGHDELPDSHYCGRCGVNLTEDVA